MFRAARLAQVAACVLSLAGSLGFPAGQAFGQAPESEKPKGGATGEGPSTPSRTASRAPANGTAANGTAAKGTAGLGALPNQYGQSWREFDLKEYTSRVTTTSRPEQAIIDWILRETGTEVWFSDPLGVLNADREKLRVYHTAEMHQLVQGTVDRFVKGPITAQAFGLRLVTIGNPNWRSRAIALMESVPVQSPGVDAWLLNRENATMLLAEMRRRADFQEHNAPQVAIFNGQSQTVSRLSPRNYVRTVKLTNSSVGFELETAQIQEGYSLQVSPLMSLDGQTVDAVIKCQIDQVEKLIAIPVELPGSTNRQSVQIQIPQLVSWRLHERFRWPSDSVLLLSCGVVATPNPSQGPAISRPIPFLSNVLPQRADALLFLEFKGDASPAVMEASRAASKSESSNRGRY